VQATPPQLTWKGSAGNVTVSSSIAANVNHTLFFSASPIGAVALSPDGHFLAIAGDARRGGMSACSVTEFFMPGFPLLPPLGKRVQPWGIAGSFPGRFSPWLWSLRWPWNQVNRIPLYTSGLIIANASSFPIGVIVAGNFASSAFSGNTSYVGPATGTSLNCEVARTIPYDLPAQLGSLFREDPCGIRALAYASNDTSWTDAAKDSIAAAMLRPNSVVFPQVRFNTSCAFPLCAQGMLLLLLFPS
jgi:hypothetical protein